MKTATLPQAVQVLDLIRAKEVPLEQLQNLLRSGLLSDLLDANVDRIDRDKFRRLCGLIPFVEAGARRKSRVKEIFLEYLAIATISATSGTETLAEATDVFIGDIDSDFERWGTNVPGEPTEEVGVQVLELSKNGKFAEIYGSVAGDLDKLCLSQGQIKSFCRNRADLIRSDGYATFLLFKVGDQFFVANVRQHVDGRLSVFVLRFGHDSVWRAGCRYRFVLPQLIVKD
jgi:hypothetical protein